MTREEAEIELQRSLTASLGEARSRELGAEIRATAEALALVLNQPVEFVDADPDFARPLT